MSMEIKTGPDYLPIQIIDSGRLPDRVLLLPEPFPKLRHKAEMYAKKKW
jgi:hypothetical protein